MNRLILVAILLSAAGAAFALQAEDERLEIATQGEIVAVSIDESTITLEETTDPHEELAPDAMLSGVQRDFVINEATKLTSSGEPIALADIDSGTMASIEYVMDYGKNVALTVDVRVPATE